MISALPEGIAAGDYAQSAEDKPALAVTRATARAWGGEDVTALVRHCAGLTVGAVADGPHADGGRHLPAARGARIPGCRNAFRVALRAGQVDRGVDVDRRAEPPDDAVVLADRTSLIRAENVVPLYRRNELTEQQVLALNEIAGELDTGALADMRARSATGADPVRSPTMAGRHPLG